MRHRRPRAKRAFIEVIERSEAERKKFAENDPLSQPFHATEFKSPREFLEPFADEPLVARTKRRKPVAQHDPVDRALAKNPALTARFVHHAGIVARACHRKSLSVDSAQHVQINKTVVEGRDQYVGDGMRKAVEMAVMPRRVDDYKIIRRRQRIDEVAERP